VKENPCGCEECEKRVEKTIELSKEEIEDILPTLQKWLAGERMRSDLDHGQEDYWQKKKRELTEASE
jgi:hypothetical protein